ncbi:hypothetical protein GUJ93_ZPchr0004g38738 [Zizania palustris]|uniref:AT-hook motif nuclear-localized protein n=1 Tax=Zizania palustris TaxID=103762 RepID=A0A8J5T4B8_ZIZPA|nr:hypothetical protein GUJ93_ZPchr0004g38738 [Zizania palustris]
MTVAAWGRAATCHRPRRRDDTRRKRGTEEVARAQRNGTEQIDPRRRSAPLLFAFRRRWASGQPSKGNGTKSYRLLCGRAPSVPPVPILIARRRTSTSASTSTSTSASSSSLLASSWLGLSTIARRRRPPSCCFVVVVSDLIREGFVDAGQFDLFGWGISIEHGGTVIDTCMDGKELLSPSELSYYAQQQQQEHQQHQQHRMLGGGGHSQSPLAGMHGGPSVIRPMPNMGMSPSAILQSIGGGSLAGMQFQMNPTPPPPLLHNSMGSVSASGSAAVPVVPQGSSPMEPVKRKRGRPRKYGPDGTIKVSAAAQQQHQLMSTPPRMGSMSGADLVSGSMLDDSAQKKRRGRPPGTGKKQHLSSPVGKHSGNAFSGSAGTSFTPHIIMASPSEDVAGKIVAFANQSSRAVCVLSAMGSVSRVVLRHSADGAASAMSRVVHASAHYKGPAIYEGLYEILSLSGSYNLMNEGAQNQSDGLSVTLCSPERHVIGGVLAGALVAASTVQVPHHLISSAITQTICF